ncbi:MAG: hypothetical protein ABIT01_02050 [Thermoanaerobaculia bacterium]
MDIIDIKLWLQQGGDRKRALELGRLMAAKALPESVDDPILAAVRSIDQPTGIRVGHLASGTPIRIDVKTLMRSAVIVGASDMGKTYGLITMVEQLLRRAFGIGLPPGITPFDIEFELVDPKSETFQLVCFALALLYEVATPETKERIAGAVKVVSWSRDRVSPFCPYENDGTVSDSFHAYLRASVAATAGRQPDTEGVRQLRFMVGRLFTELRLPPNYRLLARLLADSHFRDRLVARVSDADVRAYFADLEARLPRQTAEALLRRVQTELSFPEVKLALGIPPDALRRVLPKTSPTIVLADFGAGESLPPGVCLERASHRVTDTLRWAQRRDPSRRKFLIIEEAPTLIAGATELSEPLCMAARTLRSAGVGVWYVAQDFVGGLPPDLVRTLILNAFWLSVFRSGKGEAEWIYGHLAGTDDARGDADRKRSFLKSIEGMAPRNSYFLLKGNPALPIITDDVAILSPERKVQLRELFDREIASRSTIPAAVAADLIAKFEAEVVGAGAAPHSSNPSKKPTVGNLADLMRTLGGKSEDDDAQ